LEGVEAEIGEVGGLGMAENAKNATFLAKLVHVYAARPSSQFSRLALQRPSASRTEQSTATLPSTAMRSDEPPVTPIRWTGTAAALAAASTGSMASGDALTIARDADSPNSVAALRSASPSEAELATPTLAPMPPDSKQHSASATANPPSAQSCADRRCPFEVSSTSSR